MAYNYWLQNKVYIICWRLLKSSPPQTLCGFPTHLLRLRALCVVENIKDKPSFVLTSFWSPLVDIDGPAVQMFNHLGEVVWRVSWNDLDPQAEKFDLLKITHSDDHFFVLNRVAGCVYTITRNGEVQGSLLTGQTRPSHLAYNKKSKKLLINTDKEIGIYVINSIGWFCSWGWWTCLDFVTKTSP